MTAITTSNSMRVNARPGCRRADWLRASAQRFTSRVCVFISRVIIQGSVIVGSGSYFSSSDGPLSRETDPFFRSQVSKPPIRIGRTEHLAGLGLAIRDFTADTHARFVGRMRAPGRPGEPQSTGGEQRRYCQEQMFCFHCFLLFDSSVRFTLTAALCAEFRELACDLERRQEILVRSSTEQE